MTNTIIATIAIPAALIQPVSKSVTTIARPKLARREANILADIHTGMETIAQTITREIIAIIMEARYTIHFISLPTSNTSKMQLTTILVA